MRACFQTMDFSLTPRARRARTESLPRESIMLERVIRMKVPMGITARHAQGRAMWRRNSTTPPWAMVTIPKLGSHPRFTEKRRTIMIATQNTGADTPKREMTVRA